MLRILTDRCVSRAIKKSSRRNRCLRLFCYYWKSISQAKPDDIKIASKYLDTNKIKTLIVGQNI